MLGQKKIVLFLEISWVKMFSLLTHLQKKHKKKKQNKLKNPRKTKETNKEKKRQNFVVNAMVSAREDGFTTDVSLNIQLFSQKTIWVTIFEFRFAFSSKNKHEGSLLLSEVRKTI